MTKTFTERWTYISKKSLTRVESSHFFVSISPHNWTFFRLPSSFQRGLLKQHNLTKNLILNWVFTLPHILYLVLACLLHFKWGRKGYTGSCVPVRQHIIIPSVQLDLKSLSAHDLTCPICPLLHGLQATACHSEPLSRSHVCGSDTEARAEIHQGLILSLAHPWEFDTCAAKKLTVNWNCFHTSSRRSTRGYLPTTCQLELRQFKPQLSRFVHWIIYLCHDLALFYVSIQVKEI